MMDSQPQPIPLSERIYLRRALSVIQEFRQIQSDMPIKTASLFTHVAANPGISMSELRKQTDITQATFSRTIAVLSEWQEHDKPGFGLIWTEEDPKERRKKLIHLTEKGEELAATIGDILR
ncbi:MarR family winged helix-turn-helix transcriptional regulator [Halomonas sp. 18H]|nr:MarR family winged helix-turn-helix transcriptional regulator [Halomonas sp. 18H]MCW4147917.1 MarR family winged helix-turn-helix transcriptional regulator [Halomonas sp. 18H]